MWLLGLGSFRQGRHFQQGSSFDLRAELHPLPEICSLLGFGAMIGAVEQILRLPDIDHRAYGAQQSEWAECRFQFQILACCRYGSNHVSSDFQHACLESFSLKAEVEMLLRKTSQKHSCTCSGAHLNRSIHRAGRCHTDKHASLSIEDEVGLNSAGQTPTSFRCPAHSPQDSCLRPTPQQLQCLRIQQKVQGLQLFLADETTSSAVVASLTFDTCWGFTTTNVSGAGAIGVETPQDRSESSP